MLAALPMVIVPGPAAVLEVVKLPSDAMSSLPVLIVAPPANVFVPKTLPRVRLPVPTLSRLPPPVMIPA